MFKRNLTRRLEINKGYAKKTFKEIQTQASQKFRIIIIPCMLIE